MLRGSETLPQQDVFLDRLLPGENHCHCPYEGFADEYWDSAGSPVRSVVLPHPYPAVACFKDRIAFCNESVDITLEGLQLPRPRSIFSNTKNRPGKE